MLCKCLHKSETLEWVVECNRKYDDFIVTHDFYILHLYSTPKCFVRLHSPNLSISPSKHIITFVQCQDRITLSEYFFKFTTNHAMYVLYITNYVEDC